MRFRIWILRMKGQANLENLGGGRDVVEATALNTCSVRQELLSQAELQEELFQSPRHQ